MDANESLTPEKLELLLQSPALPPPDGTEAEFDNPPHRNKLGFQVMAACVFLQVLFSLVRAYTRIFCMRKVKLEDCEFHRKPP